MQSKLEAVKKKETFSHCITKKKKALLEYEWQTMICYHSFVTLYKKNE